MLKIDAMSQKLAFDPQFGQQISKNQSESESLQQVAEQFETLFLQMVLKNMRSASDALTGGITVQIVNANPIERERQAQAALRSLRDTPGVVEAEGSAHPASIA